MIRTLRRVLVAALAAGMLAAVATAITRSTGASADTSASATATAAAATTTTTSGSGTITAPGQPTTGAAPAGAPPGVATTTSTASNSAPGANPAPGSVTYGLSDAQGAYAHCTDTTPYCCDAAQVHCDLGAMEGWFEQPLFEKLTAPASRHRVSEIRLFVQYDALQEWNGSVSSPGCVYSRALEQTWTDAAGRVHPAGQSWRSLEAGLIEAHAEGLTPVVAISGYASPHAKPAWDEPAPDPTTVGGYWEYRCGVQGVLDAVSRLPAWAQPHIWEPFNEPDGFGIFRSFTGAQAQSCAVGAQPQTDGAAKAACLYVDGAQQIQAFANHGSDTVIAGTFVHPSAPYLRDYVTQIARQLPGARFPATWSVHDYADVTSSYAGAIQTQLAGFDQALASDSGGRAKDLWVTEAGTLLTSQRRLGDCPATGPDPAGSLGACVSGQPERQATAAAAFFALPSVAGAVPITHLFWYQWQSAANWDSALVDAAGQPRVAWCAWYGSGTCTGNPNAAP